MVRIVLCDDQEIVCEGLNKILGSDPEIEILGIGYNGNEAIQLAQKYHPDLILMDLKMPVMNGIFATQKIHNQYPEIKILVLTTYDDDEWLFDAIRSGASGYLLKDAPRQDLIRAIKGTVQGNAYVDPSITRKLLNNIAQQNLPDIKASTTHMLSERENEVLQLMARGLSNSDIARNLYLSEGTVRNYISSILSKLGVSDRTQAVLAALRHGLVNLKTSDE